MRVAPALESLPTPVTTSAPASAPVEAGRAADRFSLDGGQTLIRIDAHTAPPIRGTEADDVSKLNKTKVHKVFRPRSVEDVQRALAYARAKGLKVCMAGARHSMGGQTLFKDAVLLDMTDFKQMSLGDPAAGGGKTLRVQAGAMWSAVQEHLDERGLSVDVMQTPNFFTVGGTLSVNAHGSNPNAGPFSTNVQSLRVMLPSGEVKQASRTENPELFRAVIGGYGLFGVVLDVDIQVRDNEMYKLDHRIVGVNDFPEYFHQDIENNEQVGYFHALFDISPGKGFIRDLAIYKYTKDTGHQGKMPSLKDDWWRPARVALAQVGYAMASGNRLAKEAYWQLLSKGLPAIAPETTSRNQVMHEAMEGFRNDLGCNQTQIFQEYFIPRENIPQFVDRAREILKRYDANPAMAALRGVKKDDLPLLSYAPDRDVFGFVMCLQHDISDKNNEKLARMTRELVDAAQAFGGRHYLPYQLAYTDQQLQKAYPEADAFFDLKRRYDPGELFMNKLYAKYGAAPDPAVAPAPERARPSPLGPETVDWSAPAPAPL